ncbi:MAG: prepilin-type N-terminal cleavage/methylation domain-containing protein [Candidatus Omnitrophota bacterium]
MLTGQRGREIRPLAYPRASLNRSCGFALIEILVAAFLLSVILAALLLTLNIGHLTGSVGLVKLDLQANVRQAVDLISRDVRQTFGYEIADEENTPSPTHIKFRQVQGWDTVLDLPVFSSNYVDYNYDVSLGRITRTIVDGSGEVLETRQFNNIAVAPFYAVDFATGEILPLSANVLLTSSRLVALITGQARTRGSQVLNFSLTQEIKIRNE